MHLLLVDDDTRIRELLKKYLMKNDYQISSASCAQDAEKLMSNFDFDLIILDVMMPGEDGINFARRLRKTSNIPILMLTARGRVEDRLEGFEAGVDDFLPKPFDPRELLLRIDAILRRVAQESPQSNFIQFGNFILDIKEGRLTKSGANVDLTRTEKDLICALAKHMEAGATRFDLASAMHIEDETSRAIDVQITRLRKKIEDDPKMPRFIETVRGVGYRLKTGS